MKYYIEMRVGKEWVRTSWTDKSFPKKKRPTNDETEAKTALKEARRSFTDAKYRIVEVA